MFRVGLIPSVNPATMIKEAAPFLRQLSEAIGMETEAIVPSNYEAIGEGLCSGDLDMAFMGPAGYVIARDKQKAPIEPIARGVLDLTKSSWGRAIIITRSDSDIDDITDLKGKSFLFSDSISTSGYLLPIKVLRENGLEPATDISIPPFSGSLRKSLQQVLDGDVDAAGMGDEILDLAVLKGEVNETDIKIIYSSPSFPGSLFVLRQAEDKVSTDTTKKAVLAMSKIPFCKIGMIASMEVATDADYEIVREMIGDVQDI